MIFLFRSPIVLILPIYCALMFDFTYLLFTTSLSFLACLDLLVYLHYSGGKLVA